MALIGTHIHVALDGDSEPIVHVADRSDGKTLVYIGVESPNVVTVSGEMADVVHWLAKTSAAVAKAINDDTERRIAQAVGDAEEYAYRRAEDAIERGVA